MKEIRKTLCNRDCPDACGIVATVEDGRVTSIRGDKDHPVTRGFLCYRTSLFPSTQYSPGPADNAFAADRMAIFIAISWNEALDLAAERLTAIRRESGPAAIFHYRSGGSLGLLKHLSDYFFEQFGPVTTKRGDICSGAGDAAQEADFGDSDSHDLFDLLNSRNILLWGKNVFTSSPHLVPILREARARKALGLSRSIRSITRHRFSVNSTFSRGQVVILPSPWRSPKSFSRQGWIDPEAPSYCDHVDEFQALAKGRSVSEWCREADVPTEVAYDLAKRLGPDKPTSILVGWGMGRRINGAGAVRALDALCALSGNIGIPGGGISFYFKRRGAFDTSFVQGAKVAPRTVCEPLFGPEMLRMKDPEIRAVWVTAGNPVTMLPESETTRRALQSRDFVVVVDSFLTDTARLAHLVLPTTTLLEADDLLGSYGHHWIGVATPVVPPPEGAKSDLEIVQALAERVGLGPVMAGETREWKRRMIQPKLEPRGITLETLEAGPDSEPASVQSALR